MPFAALEEAYEAAHPDIDVQMEGHGSIQVIRHVTEIGDLVDVAVTADAALIPLLMYAVEVPETGEPFASWYIEFATGHLTLGYRGSSAYAGEIDAGNWYEVVGRPGVTLGLADPRLDAAGYRGSHGPGARPGAVSATHAVLRPGRIPSTASGSAARRTRPHRDRGAGTARASFRVRSADARIQYSADCPAGVRRPGLRLRIRERHPPARAPDGAPPRFPESGSRGLPRHATRACRCASTTVASPRSSRCSTAT